MRNFKSSLALVTGIVLSAVPIPSLAQLYVGISAPPLLPSYQQPQLTVQNQIWTPGYWAWGQGGYYWVPGTWAQPPSNGLMYTPGYWAAAQNGYQYNQGYWAPNVGYYGGVNYGSGYYGNGYTGGAWSGNAFRYNTAVTNVNTTVIRNVYVDRTVVVRNVNQISYYGGAHGLRYGPTPAQLAVVHEPHYGLTPVQREHIAEASQDRNLYASVNRGKPPVVAVARPLSRTNRPPDFKPLQTNEAKPVVHTEAKPVVHTEAKPVVHTEAKPVVHTQPKPVVHTQAKPPAQHAAPPPAHPEEKPPADAPHDGAKP